MLCCESFLLALVDGMEGGPVASRMGRDAVSSPLLLFSSDCNERDIVACTMIESCRVETLKCTVEMNVCLLIDSEIDNKIDCTLKTEIVARMTPDI